MDKIDGYGGSLIISTHRKAFSWKGVKRDFINLQMNGFNIRKYKMFLSPRGALLLAEALIKATERIMEENQEGIKWAKYCQDNYWDY